RPCRVLRWHLVMPLRILPHSSFLVTSPINGILPSAFFDYTSTIEDETIMKTACSMTEIRYSSSDRKPPAILNLQEGFVIRHNDPAGAGVRSPRKHNSRPEMDGPHLSKRK